MREEVDGVLFAKEKLTNTEYSVQCQNIAYISNIATMYNTSVYTLGTHVKIIRKTT